MCPFVAMFFRDTDEFVAPYLRCLSHANVDVVKTALNNMAEFVVLARGILYFYTSLILELLLILKYEA